MAGAEEGNQQNSIQVKQYHLSKSSGALLLVILRSKLVLMKCTFGFDHNLWRLLWYLIYFCMHLTTIGQGLFPTCEWNVP